ncbi:methyl-accepting chemotaxis protein-1 (serine sensor receptor) [Paraburkholderia sp. GAS199]|uniref:methyl-accepting chemotaxis protein n=1 Tax=Paraburkholderia sp. GAS199 TaxID=3035126 RepID=UPI003D1AF291
MTRSHQINVITVLKNISIRVRLALTATFLGLLLVIGGVMGISGISMSNSDVEQLYKDQLASSTSLSEASVSLSRMRLWLYRIALDPTSPNVPQLAQNAQKLLNASRLSWATYRALPAAIDERDLAETTNTKFDALVTNGVQPMFDALAARDPSKLADIALHTPPALFIDVTDGLDLLGKYQVSEARATFSAAQARFHRFVALAVVGIVTALIAAALSWWSLQRAISGPLDTALGHFKAIADGDLTTQIHVPGRNEMGQLMNGLQAMQNNLIQTIGAVREGATSIDTAAREIAAGNVDLSQRTEEQAASLEETSSSMEQLTSTVRQNAAHAKHAKQLVTNTASLTDQGNQASQKVVETMKELSSSSHKIAEITSVIEGIAFQTNILSLNAAVEAARAGDQGRGFAVVASDVRLLALRSATAAKEIKELTSNSLSRVSTGAQQVEDASQTMAEILESVRKVSDLMGEIAAASDEQSIGIEQINRAVAQMDQVTQQNAALVEQASAATLSLEVQASDLETVVSVFRVPGKV